MVPIHAQAVLGTDLHAVAADDALVGAEGPRLVRLPGDGDRSSGALLLADRAVSAGVRIHLQLPPNPLAGKKRLKRIALGDWLPEKVSGEIIEQLHGGLSLRLS